MTLNNHYSLDGLKHLESTNQKHAETIDLVKLGICSSAFDPFVQGLVPSIVVLRRLAVEDAFCCSWDQCSAQANATCEKCQKPLGRVHLQLLLDRGFPTYWELSTNLGFYNCSCELKAAILGLRLATTSAMQLPLGCCNYRKVCDRQGHCQCVGRDVTSTPRMGFTRCKTGRMLQQQDWNLWSLVKPVKPKHPQTGQVSFHTFIGRLQLTQGRALMFS